MSELRQGLLGYNIDDENHDDLANGDEPELLMSAFADKIPSFNEQIDPTDIAIVLNQGSLGSCQGHSLSMVFQICYYLATGSTAIFSRAAGYYLSQRKDGIKGDKGSTLSGGRWVATEHGMCCEEHWPYIDKYNPTEPDGVPYQYKLKVSRPMKTVDEIVNWIKLGLPVQTGVRWGREMNTEVVEKASKRGGGHSTCLWTMRGEHINNINSWGQTWNGDGVHCWSVAAIEEMLDNNGIFVGYSPDGFDYPEPEAITIEV
jgi:hypothetical protein